MSSFERLGVIAEIIKATQKLDWLLPTPVQDEAIPLILGGGDVMVAAETGSGKTAAFGIPILQTVYETLRGEGGTRSSGSSKSSRSSADSKQMESLPAITLSSDVCDKLFVADGLKGSSSSASWLGGRANVGVMKGRYYFEINVISADGVRVGWCSTAASYGCGLDAQSWGYGFTAKKAHNGNFDPYGVQFSAGDFVGCYVDFTKKEISFSVNGKYCGVAYTSQDIANMGNSPLFPCVVIKNGSVKFNFGRAPFHNKMRSGFKGIQEADWKHTSIYFRELAMEREISASRNNKNVACPLALILAPTRDLATQIEADIVKLGAYCTEPKIVTTLCIGGVGRMMSEVMKSHIIVGTMGSVVGLVKSHKLSMSCCKFFILDEADRVLDPKQGNQSDVLAMYSRLPNDVQVIICSATLHSDPIAEMSKKMCRNPIWVDLKGKDFVPDTVHHCILVVDPIKDAQWTYRNHVNEAIITDGVHRRDQIQWNAKSNLSELTKSEAIKILKPLILKKIIDAFKMDQCLIFCRTRLDCDNLAAFLTKIGGGRAFRGAVDSGKENPYSCIALHSGIPQHERNDNLKMFKNGDVRFLICTDVAARGIDIKSLPYVINVTMPAEDEDYVHRVGRVGRADQAGIAISIISSQKEKVWYHANCPDRGKTCQDTRLVEKGGCCIWYDEVKIFEKVEQRLGGNPIPILDQDKHLSSSNKIEQFIRTIEAQDPLLTASEKKLKKLLPTIQHLNQLEVMAQNQYLSIPQNFANLFRGDGDNVDLNQVEQMLQDKMKRKKKRTGKKKRGGKAVKKRKEKYGATSGPVKG
eukprot:CAMPEP_0197049336 /NCGR_PEP_ID=MMETSP1384-20130603/24496_1 /TAXON_ID=29189 /ORGANISM="Ammonia sp." /LENGTH=808 /DNA_ID=CAMNT_0042481599 /DNA_START=30 /DNA_END=2456 /DNA_ORIENTATION=+